MKALKAYNIFRKNFSDEDALILAEYFESVPKDVLTKADIKDMATKTDIAHLKTDLKDLELRLIKWILGTSIGTVVTMFGMLKIMIK